jgi:hypothetical protein
MTSTPRSTPRRREERRRSPLDTVVVALLWLVPMSLFGYIGWHLAVALGHDPVKFLGLDQLWLVAALACVALLALGGVIAYRSRRQARELEASPARWDRYSTPY